MILSLSSQARLFLATVAVGGLLGMLFDMFRIFRLAIPHKSFLLQIEDAVYWILVLFTMFFFMMHKNYGEIRFFSVCGAFLGMLLYFFTLSFLVMSVSGWIIHAVKYLLKLFFTIVSTPFVLLFKLFSPPVKKVKGFAVKKTKKMLHFSKAYGTIKKRNWKCRLRAIVKKQ